MTGRSISRKEKTGSATEGQGLDLPIPLASPTKSMGQARENWLQPRALQRPVDISFGKGPVAGVKRKAEAAGLPPPSERKELSDLDLDGEDHIATLDSDGQIICPKCGAEVTCVEEESEDEYFVDDSDDPTGSEDLDFDESDLEE